MPRSATQQMGIFVQTGWGVAFRAVCFVARLANMQRLFDAARFAHPIPESRRRGPVEFFNTLLSLIRSRPP
ncbi:MAG TPA: hypothetical protein VHE58_07650 [Burkholderiales bacterium]|nr:hypothetical protein [Burkholderiales bacterium]